MTSFLTQNKIFLLAEDLRENRQWQVWAGYTRISCTVNGTTITAADLSALKKGDRVTGTGIPAGTTIVSVGSGTATLSQSATNGTGVTLSFFRRLVQENGTNPKVSKLTLKDANNYIGVTQLIPEYACRIVKADNLYPLISGKFEYQLMFPSGSPARFRVVEVQESQQQDLSWTLILARIE